LDFGLQPFNLKSAVGFLEILRAGKTRLKLRSFSAFNCAAAEIAQHGGRRTLWQP
jgi:hypothetical protein